MWRVGILALVLWSLLGAEDPASYALAHRLKNCEVEIAMLKNSIASQEQSRDALEKEVSCLLKATREALRESGQAPQAKIAGVEKTAEKLSLDCKQLKAHANELSKLVNELSKSVLGMKESVRQQGQAIKELEQALRAMATAMGGKAPNKKSAK